MQERVDYLSREGELLDKKPHISVWQSQPGPHTFPDTRDKYRKNQDWYVCLNWEEDSTEGRDCTGQINFTDHDTKSIISKCAILIGKELNIPVIRHEAGDMTLLWKPEKRMTKDQKEWLNHLIAGTGK